MYREIKIGDKKVPMLANGATPIRYRMVFGKDVITEFQNADTDSGKAASSVTELAFIMNKAAEAQENKASLSTLNMDTFVEWLEQFEPLDITLAAEEIVGLYMGNGKGLSEAKKKTVRASERQLTTALYDLRCIQVGLRLSDLDVLDYGFVMDMITESNNDDYKYRQKATQADFDKF